jgi:two-component system NtrC family sensor kinase
MHPFKIFDSFQEEVVVIDKNFRIVYANEKYAKDLGYSSPEDVIGQFCYVVSHHQKEPCDGECHPCPLREIERTGGSVSVVHTHYTHDNQEFAVEIHAFPIQGGERILQIIRDIKSDKEKFYLFSLSQKLSSVGFLAMGIAHQLNTPLGTILLAIEELEEKVGPSEELELIKKSVNSCKDYVNKLLLMVKRNGSDPVNISRAVEDTVDLLKVIAKEKDVELTLTLDGDGYLLGSESDVRHLIMNLILNAVQVSEKGDRVEVYSSVSNGSWRLIVRDYGPGIEQEELSKIFIPFYQGKNRKGDGAGLGLAIVNSIVKNYNGSINVSSTKGEGTTFEVTVPLS